MSAVTVREFPVARTGTRVLRDLERFLVSGEARCISRGLYDELTQHCGFIAHYDLSGFRWHFDGRPERLVAGELQPLTELREPVSVYRYTDGLTSTEVLAAFRCLAANWAARQ